MQDISCPTPGNVRFLNVIIDGQAWKGLCSLYLRGDCPPGTHGPACDKNCSVHCAGADHACSHVDGGCYGGCEPGYTGDTCDQKCSHGKYGSYCLESCSNCKDADCNHTDGICSHGCEDGYQGTKCEEMCPRGRYGHHCAETCSDHCAKAWSHLESVRSECIEKCSDTVLAQLASVSSGLDSVTKAMNREGCLPLVIKVRFHQVNIEFIRFDKKKWG
ncbi:hypothetical protein RRG08_055575 [Elysia crispata]|uniref:Uncharacterized protein n=1 Tax=Elysia crispata TaxID=231223 RepID=A0AAE0YJB3_9GAST|nr:hypothetical protein RRG08_055575 [Elysia crispata]